MSEFQNNISDAIDEASGIDTTILTDHESRITTLEKTNNIQQEIIEGLEKELELAPSIEGTSMQIADSANARCKIIPIANTEQETVEAEEGITVTDTDIHVTDAIASKSASIFIEANTYQESREFYNLFDKDSFNYLEGYYNSNLEFVESTLTGYTNMKIPVTANTEYTLANNALYGSIDTNQQIVSAVYFYDSNYTLLSRTLLITTEIYNFTTPENCNYIEIQFGISRINSIIDTLMILLGTYTEDTLPEYEPYGATPSPKFPSPIRYVRGKFESYNLFNKDDLSYEMGFKDVDGNFQSSTLTGYTNMKIPVTPNTEYTIGKLLTTDINSSTANAVVNAIYFYDKDYNYITRTESIKVYDIYSFTTLENCAFIEIQITINPIVTDGNTFNDIIDTFMLLVGTYTIEDFPIYLPYGTLDNPYEIKKQNKNICPDNFSEWESGQYDATTGDKVKWGSRVRLKELLKVEPLQSYYFDNQFIATTERDIRWVLRGYDKNKNIIISFGGLQNKNSLDIPENVEYLGVGLYDAINLDIELFSRFETQFKNGEIKPVICEEKNFQLNLRDYKLAEVGNSKDHFDITYVEEEGYKRITNVDYVEENKIIEFNGSENWSKSVATTSDRFLLTLGDITTIQTQIVKANYFKSGNFSSEKIGEIWHNKSKVLVINYNEYGTTSLEDFISWLQEKYTEGNPLQVLYTLEVPITTKVTDETLIAQFELLLNIGAFEGVNNINSEATYEEQVSLPNLRFHYNYEIATPSPIKKSEIKVVKGNYEIKKQNKNYLKYDKNTNVTNLGITAEVDDKGIITLNGTPESGQYLDLQNLIQFILYANFNKDSFKRKYKAGTYTMSVNYISGTKGAGNNVPIYFRDKLANVTFNQTFIIPTSSTKPRESITFTIEEDLDAFVYLFLANTSFTDFKFSVQIEEGEVATNFIAHEEETFQLNLGDYKLAELGASKDYFDISYVDENGYKKITRLTYTDRIKFYDFTGEENVSLTTSGNSFRIYAEDILRNTNTNENADMLSNMYKIDTWNNRNINNSKGTFAQYDNSIGFDKGDFLTVEDFKAHLTDLYNSGNPLKIAYPLANPITTEVTDTTLIAQLEALINTMTHKEVTNINTSKSSDVEELADLKVSIEYFKSNLIRIKNIEKAIISMGGNV